LFYKFILTNISLAVYLIIHDYLYIEIFYIYIYIYIHYYVIIQFSSHFIFSEDKILLQDDNRKYHTSFITAIIRAIASCRIMAEFLRVIAGSCIEITNWRGGYISFKDFRKSEMSRTFYL